MFSLIATDTQNHIIVHQVLPTTLLELGVAKVDEDGDIEITELHAAAAHCWMMSYTLLAELGQNNEDEAIAMYAEAGGLFSNAAKRSAKVVALRRFPRAESPYAQV